MEIRYGYCDGNYMSSGKLLHEIKGRRIILVILAAMSSFSLFVAPLDRCLAEQNQPVFQKDADYDIYYVFDDHSQYITMVKIVGIVTIGGLNFLEMQTSNLPTQKKISGYISISNIVAILPAGSPRPQNLN